MSRYLFVLVFAAAMALPSVLLAAQEKGPADTVEGMAGEIIKHYPRAEGHVTSADEEKVRLDIGGSDGLRAGMEVFLFRPGKPIRHPVTKAILGNREEPLGRMTLTDVGDKTSEGKIKTLLATRIIPGDVGRLSTEKDKLLLTVYGKDYNELVLDRLIGMLRESGRFEIIGPALLPKDFVMDADAVKKLVKDKGADDLITLRTTPVPKLERAKVDLALYSPDGGVKDQRSGVVDMNAEVFGEKVMDIPLVRGEHRDFYRVEDLPYRGRLLAMGNIMGEGKQEVVVSDGHGLTVYRFEEGVLHEVWREEGLSENNHLDIECADLNGNGLDEIYVTNFNQGQGKLSSYVLEHDGTGFRRICEDAPLFFRVLEIPGAGKALITSTIGSDAPYSGIIRIYGWDKGVLRDGGVLRLPRKIKDPYGFVLLDLIPDKKEKAGVPPAVKKQPLDGLEIVWVDDSDYLQVLDMKGKRIWKSKERYGGYDNFFELDKKKFALQNVDNRGKVKGAIIVRDDPEGGKEVVLTKNIPIAYTIRRFKGYSGAEVYALAWNGVEMETRWSFKNVDGYLAGICAGDVSNNGRESVILLTAPTMKMLKKSKNLPVGGLASLKNPFTDKSSLLVYKAPQR